MRQPYLLGRFTVRGFAIIKAEFSNFARFNHSAWRHAGRPQRNGEKSAGCHDAATLSWRPCMHKRVTAKEAVVTKGPYMVKPATPATQDSCCISQTVRMPLP